MTLLFSFSQYEFMANELLQNATYSKGEFLVERFLNGEIHITLQVNVKNKICILLGSISPPDENLVTYLALSHTLKKEGAKKCIALLPYLAYMRHEHDEPKKSRLSALIAPLFKTSGIDQVITVDIHSKAAASLFSIPLISLSPAQIFAKKLKKIPFIPDTIIAPDVGAIKRSIEVTEALQLSLPITYMEKKRDLNLIMHSNLIGHIGKKVVIIDDILDSGETLISCTKKLLEYGAEEIIIMISHGLFSGERWKELKNLGVKNIYTTNTTSYQNNLVEELSIIPLIKEHLCKL